MRLKSLEIVGFKSFADPFRIDFKQGISSIVGPNGCGKSNIADAIRWVLGTQSPKQLRAEKMESVIFTGSSKRKQLGMAEVSLTFDNSDRALDLDYDEVSVSRRLFRSGDSEYSINGAKCRLMDITDLVVDRGLGSTGYWILESKMVGTILSSRPEDRRFLFDEAAGIVKYKIQRHRAELKLDSAASDLERLTDIIAEVDSTCRGLKKQVASYRKHERVTGNINALREALSLMESLQIRKKLEECTLKLDRTGADVGQLTAGLSARSTVLTGVRTEFSLVQGKLDEAHRICADLDSKLASNDREIAVTSEKIENSRRRISENRARIARERERIEIYSRDIQALDEERLELVPEIGRLEEECSAVKLKVSQASSAVSRAVDELASVKNRRVALEKQIEDRRREHLQRVREEEARTQRISWLEQAVRESEAGRIRLLEERSSLSEQRDALAGKMNMFRDDLLELQNQISALESERALLSDNIREEAERSAVLGEKVRRLEEILNNALPEKTLSSRIVPCQGMGKALGAFVSGFDNAVPSEDLPGDAPGTGSLHAILPGGDAVDLPPEAVPLSQCVKSCSSEVLSRILLRGVLAPDRDTACSWLKAGIGIPVVTPEGDLFRPEGFVRIGVSPENAGSLELQQLLEENRELLHKSRAAGDSHQKLLMSLTERKNSLLAGSKEKENLIRTCEKELSGLETILERSLSQEKSITAEAEKLTCEMNELQHAASEMEPGETPSAVTSMQEEREVLLRREEECSSELSRLETVHSAVLRESDSTGFQLKEKNTRLEETAQRILMMKREADRVEDLTDELGRSNSSSESEITSLEQSLEELNVAKLSLGRDRGNAETRRSSCSAERNGLMERSAIVEKEVQELREKLGRAKSLMMEKEAEARTLREKLSGIEDSLNSEDNPFLDLDAEEVNSRLETEKTALERIGPVNMLAVNEYEENSRRLEYLSEQKNDLEEARASLSRAITEINQEAASRFKETFDQVRVHFREMFVRLFGGGEGDIVSLEGDDPLEGGIEIMARPRGKKLKNVIALSEGEKAMTAVALLFSLYLVKPSPFCVLDELDGPFDDSNTDKFIAILRDFSLDTQFIVITHNKRTMEGSDILYGITMAEEGVSTITSVSLEEMVSS